MDNIRYIKAPKDKFWNIIRSMGVKVIEEGNIDGTSVVEYNEEFYEVGTNYDRLTKEAYIKWITHLDKEYYNTRYIQDKIDSGRGWSA